MKNRLLNKPIVRIEKTAYPIIVYFMLWYLPIFIIMSAKKPQAIQKDATNSPLPITVKSIAKIIPVIEIIPKLRTFVT